MKSQRIGLSSSIADWENIPIRLGTLEVVVFGRGYGESILIRCENDDIIIIDSFLNPDTHKPIPLDYLDKLGIPHSNIKMVIITHWHQDHIRGVSKILDCCIPTVQVILNPIIRNHKYMNYLIQKEKSDIDDANEFFKVLEIVKNRKLKKVFVSAHKTIYNTLGGTELITLSPQDEEINEYIEGLLSEREMDDVLYSLPDDNLLSVVLLLKHKNMQFLLGSDMENKQLKTSGWKAIVHNYLPRYSKSSFFKVPHHGSATGYCEEVWEKLLSKKPCSICTTYNKRKNIPSEDDKLRITQKSSELFVVGEIRKKDVPLTLELKKYNINKDFDIIPSNFGFIRVVFNEKIETIESVGVVYKYTSI